MKIIRIARHPNYICYFRDWEMRTKKIIRLYHTGNPLPNYFDLPPYRYADVKIKDVKFEWIIVYNKFEKKIIHLFNVCRQIFLRNKI